MGEIVRTLLAAAHFDAGYQQTFEEKLFFDGPDWARRLVNYVALLIFATFIATFGVIGDSTPIIIGAMLVAPLMTPILATTAALVIGQGVRVVQSLALAIGGIALVIALATLVTLVLPHETISFTTNSAITSRISPKLLDLLAALASGAAGAYIVMRPEIIDAFGGVAIAISLVPPLCVVGVSLGTGHWSAAVGAMLLFVTNFLSILLAGGIVFRLAGVGVHGEMPAAQRSRAFVAIVVATALIAIPLGILSYRSLLSARETSEVTAATEAWLGPRPYDITAVAIDQTSVSITVSGDGALAPVAQLDSRIESELGRAVKVIVYVVPKKPLDGASARTRVAESPVGKTTGQFT